MFSQFLESRGSIQPPFPSSFNLCFIWPAKPFLILQFVSLCIVSSKKSSEQQSQYLWYHCLRIFRVSTGRVNQDSLAYSNLSVWHTIVVKKVTYSHSLVLAAITPLVNLLSVDLIELNFNVPSDSFTQELCMGEKSTRCRCFSKRFSLV